MAYFKLSLLTPRYKNNDIFFLQDVITEWDSPVKTYQDNIDVSYEQQLFDNTNDALYENTELPLYAAGNAADSSGIQGLNRNHTGKKSSEAHSLTYNEKLSKHRNGQKDLTFSMNQMIIRQDEWFENPFCRLITNGTQLLLEDQYNKQYIFTVTNIKFNIKENNIIYDVTCQDSFSYQLSRQNNGYTIENDSSSADFIGARTLDWWVSQKIAKECYLYNYQYIPLFKGLYIKTDNSISLPYSTLSANDVKEIIKEIYLPADYNLDSTVKNANDQDYYETIPFSCSGSSALNALISLAETLNMQVVVFEHLNSDFSLTRYFWFEPQKNDDRIGLMYSPNKNIQNFGLTHKGDSLTTILNVNGPEYNDELITLIPSIPSFWGTYINSKEWRDSEYAPGMFSMICSSQSQTITFPVTTRSSGNIVEFSLNNLAGDDNKYEKLHHAYYNKFNFWFSGVPSTTFSENNTYSAQHTSFKLIRTINNQETPFNENEIIPPYVEGESWSVRVQPVEASQSYGATIYITLYRDVTEDERNFATIADACPWLENKLINFEYFYNNNIISKKEYEEITNKVNNELRKINGQLLWYNQAHYNAIHRQTKLIADLTNKLDLLGATFQSDFISPLEEHSSIGVDINNFTNAYNDIFSGSKHYIDEKTLINLDSIKEEYATKYFNAQQRFLKNIYNFRNFFYQNNSLYNQNLYEHKLTLIPTESVDINGTYGFDILKFNLITNDFNLYDTDTGKPFVNIYQQKDNQILPVEIAYNGRQMYYAEQFVNPQQALVYAAENTYCYGTMSEGVFTPITYLSTYADLIKHYLKVRSTSSLNNYYYYSKDYIYTVLPGRGSGTNAGPYRCVTHLKQDILLSSLNSFGRNLSGTITEDILWQYLPVNNFYIKKTNHSIVYKKLQKDITGSERVDNDKREYYYWYARNSKKESIKNYVEYVDKRQNGGTQNKDLDSLIPISNPYLYSEQTFLPLDFISPDNEGLKYRLINGTYAPQTWTYWAAGFLTLSTLGLSWLFTLCKQYWSKDWTTQGGPDYDVMGNRPQEGNRIPFYATDSNWYDSFQQYKESFDTVKEKGWTHTGSIMTIVDAEPGKYWETIEPYLKLGFQNLNLSASGRFTLQWHLQHYTPEVDALYRYFTEQNKWSYNYRKAYSLSTGTDAENVYYISNNYKILNPDTLLHTNHNYYMCVIDNGNNANGSIFIENDNSKISNFENVDDVTYYPYTTRFIKLNAIDINNDNKNLLSILNQLYPNATISVESTYIINITQNNDNIKVVFYEQFIHAKNTLTAEVIDDLDVEKDIYDSSTNQLADFSSKSDFWTDIYELNNELVWHETNNFDSYIDEQGNPHAIPENSLFYDKPNLNTRLYRVSELKDNTPPIQGYYINATEKTDQLFISTPSSYTISIYKYDIASRGSEVLVKNLILTPKDFSASGSSYIYNFDSNYNIQLNITIKDQIWTKTNGEFWYNYKNSSHPVLQQQALSIETQLTQYWSTAYIASKYCEYFIPEHWFSQQSGTTGYFNICIPIGNSVELNSIYVPIVTLLRDENNSTLLPRYSFKKSLLPKNSIFSKEEEFKDKINYASASTLNNVAIRNALRNIGEDTISWLFEENGKTSYYYVEDTALGTGYTWANFAKTYNQQFSEFSGLYIMFYKLISGYTNQDESRYYELKQEHDNFWSQLYHDYGYLLLENVYTNENATNSLDLLKMAKLYFKDLNTPERQYNITVIDTASLDNYKGEEIRIGDGIRVNAQEFYNEYDVIYQSLSQYLFVSDISYSLRQVTDISLTVNDIKYSDKMIQRLAKLIK